MLQLLLMWVTLLCSVYPYALLYTGRHNSLYDDLVYVTVLASLTLLYRRDFYRFLMSKRNPLNGFALAVLLLLAVDVSINTPLNQYKVKMYVVLAAMYVLVFLFKQLEDRWKTRFVVVLLVIWLAVSVLELYLRWTRPQLYQPFPWNSMSLQSALMPLVTSGYLTLTESKVYGLGIGSQANVIAIMALLILMWRGQFAAAPRLLRYGPSKVLVALTAITILPFTLSLTAIIAFLCAVLVLKLKNIRLTAVTKTVMLTIVVGVVLLYSFEIGGVFRFAATSESRDRYLYEFVDWPLQYLSEHLVMIAAGLHNDLTRAPLENRYFNVLLTLGLPLFLYVMITLARIGFRLLAQRATADGVRARVMIFVLLAVAYAHIGFTAHGPGLIMFATLFVFATAPAAPAGAAAKAAANG